jgi:hypothetical protein
VLRLIPSTADGAVVTIGRTSITAIVVPSSPGDPDQSDTRAFEAGETTFDASVSLTGDDGTARATLEGRFDIATGEFGGFEIHIDATRTGTGLVQGGTSISLQVIDEPVRLTLRGGITGAGVGGVSISNSEGKSDSLVEAKPNDPNGMNTALDFAPRTFPYPLHFGYGLFGNLDFGGGPSGQFDLTVTTADATRPPPATGVPLPPAVWAALPCAALGWAVARRLRNAIPSS